MSDNTIKELAIFFVFMVVYSGITSSVAYENDSSRLAAVESLVERGSFIIDESTLMPGVDKILVDGHFYSSKPPMLSLIGALPYAVIHKFFGLSFRENAAACVYLVTLLTIVSTSSLLMVFFYKSLRFIDLSERQKNFLVFVMGFGTLLFTYSGTFNAHTISSFFVFLSFYLLLKTRFEGVDSPLHFFLCGLSASVAGGIEPPLYVAFLAFALYTLKSTKKENVVYYLAGGLIPLLVYAQMNLMILNSVIPMHLQPNKKIYYPLRSWSQFETERVPRPEFLFNSLIGYRGIFSLTPVLLLCFYSIMKVARNRGHKFFLESIIFLVIFLLIYSYYFFIEANYGGNSVGLRRMINLTPFFVFFLGILLEEKLSQRLATLVITASLMSFILAAAYSSTPWGLIEPKLFYAILSLSAVIGLIPLTNKLLFESLKRYAGLSEK